MSYDAIFTKVEEKIFRIINRPEKLNAMSRQLLSELDSAQMNSRI
jgi:enoyl-CoA hydratase/carnithine racemase